jgi:hypothetical protein
VGAQVLSLMNIPQPEIDRQIRVERAEQLKSNQ